MRMATQTSHHMDRKNIKQSIEELFRAEKTRFVELLLLEVVVLVHGLHERAQHVNGGVADPVNIAFEGLDNLDADLLTEPGQNGEGGEAGFGGHQAPQGVELLLQVFVRNGVLVTFAIN